MPETKRRKRGYQQKTNAINITLHTMDGAVLPPEAKQRATEEIERIARLYGLLTHVVET